MPTREGVLAFFGNQVLVNAAAWTAGVIAAGLVKNFFEVKGFRNLWGLTASSSRSLVSADDYQMIMTLASYAAGLIMLIFMRHLIVRLIAEFHSLRIERARGDRASDAAPAESGGSGPLTTPDPNRCAPFAEAGRESGGRRVPAHSRIRVAGLEFFPDDLADD